jgi:26S proteasome regulatory subunit N9
VNAAYYSVAADYYKVNFHVFIVALRPLPIGVQAKAEYAPYYKHSLLFLACIDISTDLTAEDRLQRAHDLGISAFLGDTIYNFGELVSVLLSWIWLWTHQNSFGH